MGWFKDLFGGKSQNGVGGDGPSTVKLNSVDELYGYLLSEFEKYPSLIATLEVNHINPYTGTHHTRKPYLKMRDGIIYAFNLTHDIIDYRWATDTEVTRETILKIVADDYNKRAATVTLHLEWSLTWITPSTIPKVADGLVTNALASAIPFTARQVFEGLYVTGKASEGDAAIYSLASKSGNYFPTLVGDIPNWYIDLAFSEGFLQLPVDPNKYIITDPHQVDRKILPITHWRRWVHVTEAENNAKAAIKYVPRDSGCGYVRYFDVTFIFDDPVTAGMAFDAGELLWCAVAQQQSQLDVDIPDKSTCYYEGRPISYGGIKSNVYLNPDHMKVSWQDNVATLQDWLDLQRESETNLERPYFSPNTPATNILGNTFSIDADYYINYTPWTPVK